MIAHTRIFGDGTTEFLSALLPFIGEIAMNGIIYIIGAVVVIAAILSFFGLR